MKKLTTQEYWDERWGGIAAFEFLERLRKNL